MGWLEKSLSAAVSIKRQCLIDFFIVVLEWHRIIIFNSWIDPSVARQLSTRKKSIRCCLFIETMPDRLFPSRFRMTIEWHRWKQHYKIYKQSNYVRMITEWHGMTRKKSISCCLYKETSPDRLILSRSNFVPSLGWSNEGRMRGILESRSEP